MFNFQITVLTVYISEFGVESGVVIREPSTAAANLPNG